MFKFKVTFTNSVGSLGFFYALYLQFEIGIWASLILILGKQIEPLLIAWKGRG